jgi:hypothetical protein
MSQGRKWQVLILGLILRAKSIDVLSFKYPLFLIKILSCVKKKKRAKKTFPEVPTPDFLPIPYVQSCITHLYGKQSLSEGVP